MLVATTTAWNKAGCARCLRSPRRERRERAERQIRERRTNRHCTPAAQAVFKVELTTFLRLARIIPSVRQFVTKVPRLSRALLGEAENEKLEEGNSHESGGIFRDGFPRGMSRYFFLN